MKKNILLGSLLLFVTLLTGCNGNSSIDDSSHNTNPQTSSNNSSNSSNNALVTYFSRSGENWQVGYVSKGSTEVVAEMISEEINSNLFRIEPVIPYPDDYNEMLNVSREETRTNARPDIKYTIDDFDNYDTIFLGYPIWNGTCPMIIRTFIESYDFSEKTIIPFSTHAGSGLGSSVSVLKSELPNARILDGFSIQGTMAQNNLEEARKQVKNYIDGLDIDFSNNEDEEALKEVYNMRLEAMVEQDVNTLSYLMDDDLILRHITGKTQTKKEWLNDVASGNMFYINIENTKMDIKIDGDRATIDHTNIIEARIYGSYGTWTLSGTSYYVKRSNRWIWTNAPSN